MNSNRIADDHTGQNIFDQDVWSSLPLDQEIDLDSIVPSGDSLPKTSGNSAESSASPPTTPGRTPNNSSSGSLLGTSRSTMGTELAIGIVVAMLSIGLFLAHRRKNKSKKEFFVEVGDGDAPPEKPAKTEMASPTPRSVCSLETERAAGGRNIIPVVEVTDENNSFGPMYEV